MQFKDQIDFVRQHVKRNRLRVATTVLATAMGCAFLIVLASIAFGLQGSLEKDILSADNLTKISVETSSETPIKEAEVKKIEHVVALTKTTQIVHDDISPTMKIGDNKGYLDSIFVDFNEEKNAKIKLSDGQYPTNINDVILGYNAAQALISKVDEAALEQAKEGEKVNVGLKENVLGKKITVTWISNSEKKKSVTRQFTVVGIGAKPKNTLVEDTSIKIAAGNLPALYKDFKTVLNPQFKEESDTYSELNVYADSLENVKAVNEQLKKMDYSTYTVSQQLDEMNLIFTALKAGLIFVGAIAVIIASIGIFNTMTMAVTERTREIGVMKAIGASPKLIQRLFVMESAYIGIIGTAIAIVVSYIISMLANFLIPQILYLATNEDAYKTLAIKFSEIPIELVLIAAAISIGVAILSGWRPAKKATKINVIQALKQD